VTVTQFRRQLAFAAILWVKLFEMFFHCDIAEKRFVGKLVITQTFSYKPTDRTLLKQHDKSSPVNSTHFAILHPQNGDRVVNIDYVTSFHLYVHTGVKQITTIFRQRDHVFAPFVYLFCQPPRNAIACYRKVRPYSWTYFDVDLRKISDRICVRISYGTRY